MYRLFSPRIIIVLGMVILADIYLVSAWSSNFFSPDLWVMFLVYYYFYFNRRRVIVFAPVLGFIRDLLGQGIFGAQTLSTTIASFVLVRLGSTFNRERFYVQMVSVFFVCLVSMASDLVIEAFFYRNWIWLNWFSERIFWTSFATALISPVVLGIMRRFVGVAPKQYELFSEF